MSDLRGRSYELLAIMCDCCGRVVHCDDAAGLGPGWVSFCLRCDVWPGHTADVCPECNGGRRHLNLEAQAEIFHCGELDWAVLEDQS